MTFRWCSNLQIHSSESQLHRPREELTYTLVFVITAFLLSFTYDLWNSPDITIIEVIALQKDQDNEALHNKCTLFWDRTYMIELANYNSKHIFYISKNATANVQVFKCKNTFHTKTYSCNQGAYNNILTSLFFNNVMHPLRNTTTRL